MYIYVCVCVCAIQVAIARKLPWGRANLNYTAQALVISTGYLHYIYFYLYHPAYENKTSYNVNVNTRYIRTIMITTHN